VEHCRDRVPDTCVLEELGVVLVCQFAYVRSALDVNYVGVVGGCGSREGGEGVGEYWFHCGGGGESRF
jgi:hypothetical protein